MRRDLLILAADLAKREEAFVLATVVRRLPASSAQPGDMALITESGTFHGWLGGSCTQPTVVREALRALAEGMPRLIALSPDPESDRRPGVSVFPMTCHSGGSVDIYVAPVLPPPRLTIFGLSPAAQALSRLAKAMGYAVDAADPGADRARFPEADRVFSDLRAPELLHPPPRGTRLFAVVATMGERDEEAILAALALEPAYLGVVASSKRFAQIEETLLARGASPESLKRIKSPAGLDLGARTPEEIALSILAEIVQVRAKAQERGSPETGRAAAQEERDPVCGMTVEVATAIHQAEVRGRNYYFCCAACRERFLAMPERFAPAQPGGAA
ncbi:MAG: XdhC family protein [Thermoanaerobaculia bacterium]